MLASPENIMAELDNKITYTENTLLLLCDVTSGIKKALKELDKAMPPVLCRTEMADYEAMVNFCKEHNVICLETYYRKKQERTGEICVRI